MKSTNQPAWPFLLLLLGLTLGAPLADQLFKQRHGAANTHHIYVGSDHPKPKTPLSLVYPDTMRNPPQLILKITPN